MHIAAEFVTSAVGPRDFPRDRLPEVAFVGRSNVGKSSLINALARRRIARTSAEPGKTRLVNFYRVQRGTAPPVYLVDLPGYGYARAARPGEIAAEGFEALTSAYFERPGARAVLLLVDARHPGLDADRKAWEWLRGGAAPAAVIGTKADKLSRAERVSHARALHSSFDGPVTLVSAQTGEGLEELWKLIARLPNQTAA